MILMKQYPLDPVGIVVVTAVFIVVVVVITIHVTFRGGCNDNHRVTGMFYIIGGVVDRR